MGDWEREFGAGTDAESVIEGIGRSWQAEQDLEALLCSLTARKLRGLCGTFELICPVPCSWHAKVDLFSAPDDVADVKLDDLIANERWRCHRCGGSPFGVALDRKGRRLGFIGAR